MIIVEEDETSTPYVLALFFRMDPYTRTNFFFILALLFMSVFSGTFVVCS